MRRLSLRFFFLLLGSALAVAGCAERPFVWIANLPPPDPLLEAAIHSRDAIMVAVRDQPALSGEFVVREDGGIFIPTIGEVAVNGRLPADVTAELRGRLATLIVKPDVRVSIARVAPIRVNVIGEVKTPATYELNRDRTVTAALAAAGWLTEFANRDRIFVVRHVGSTRVRFRATDVTSPGPAVARFSLGDGDVVVVE
ncbi:MAG: Polysaccharide export protein [Myxococcales bacterium]|nr:Polysaccharide export protein [Myxococcales bacterium]